jgi:hypothetical protein
MKFDFLAAKLKDNPSANHYNNITYINSMLRWNTFLSGRIGFAVEEVTIVLCDQIL